MAATRITDAASEDLYQLWNYLSQRSEAAADRLLDTISDRIHLISELPGIGKARDDLGEGIRTFVVNDVIIFYRKIAGGIEVARVLDGRRDYGRLFT